jgi:dTDP-4-amino-4,6-dideoxygalactose transaminase
VTNDDAVADHVRVLRSHGSRKKYFHDMPGFNSRLDSLQAAILKVKLGHLADWLERRREIAATYADLLSGVDGISLLAERVGARHIYNYYTLRVAGGALRRDGLAMHLKAQGIATAVYYPGSLHLQPVYAALGHHRGDFPASEAAQDEVLSLPMYPELTDSQVKQVAAAIMSCPDFRATG